MLLQYFVDRPDILPVTQPTVLKARGVVRVTFIWNIPNFTVPVSGASIPIYHWRQMRQGQFWGKFY